MSTFSLSLNGLTPAEFMADYWQKKPLLIRAALPGFYGFLSPEELAGLACESEVPSRLIQCDPRRADQGAGWQVQHGPLDDDDFSRLPKQDWTLLVQGVNHVLPEAQALLAAFDFIPTARLDDVMVSYAPTGGGVGPHVDSYDVFLLQGAGHRRWRISQQADRQYIADAPLRLLAHFETEQEWVLGPGDMLYLPPHVAHWGIAEDDDCMTYSIGFRAPAARELAIEFLEHCRQEGWPDTLYQDPDQPAVSDACEVSAAMANQVAAMLRQLTWDPQQLGPFLAKYLSEPKPYVLFEPPRAIKLATWKPQALARGVALDLQSQLLRWQARYYLNGEMVIVPASTLPMLNRLANQRMLSASDLSAPACLPLIDWLHQQYLLGYLHLAEAAI